MDMFDSKHFIILRLEKLIQNILNKVSCAMIKYNIFFKNSLKMKVHVDIMIFIPLFCIYLNKYSLFKQIIQFKNKQYVHIYLTLHI